jgi:hypothetical protein
LRQAGYEFGSAIPVEIVGDDQVLLCPFRKFSRDGPLPVHAFIGITSRAKLLKERFDLVIKQTL